MQGYFTNTEAKDPGKQSILEQEFARPSPRPVYYQDHEHARDSELCFEHPLYPYDNPNDFGSYQERFQPRPEPTAEPSTLALTLKYMGRLAGLWFVTVAAGSVLCSIPVSALGLPVILFSGLTALIAVSVLAWLYQLWIKALIMIWNLVKYGLQLPSLLLKWATKKVKKSILSLFSSAPVDQVSALPTRRYSTASRMTNLSDDLLPPRWRHYDQLEGGRLTYPSGYGAPNTEYSPSMSTPPSVLSGIYHPLDYEKKHFNRLFHFLNQSQTDRIEFCRQLYATYANLPKDKTELYVGQNPIDGREHHILSLWDEPDVNCPLSFTNLIGFCEYVSHMRKPRSVHIDKLYIAHSYSESIFTRMLILKLMKVPHIHQIVVWSLWSAEEFYKNLGFRNVSEKSTPTNGKRGIIVSESGPLMMWISDPKPRERENISNAGAYDQASTLSRNDSLISSNRVYETSNIGRSQTLNSKDSMTTMVSAQGEGVL